MAQPRRQKISSKFHAYRGPCDSVKWNIKRQGKQECKNQGKNIWNILIVEISWHIWELVRRLVSNQGKQTLGEKNNKAPDSESEPWPLHPTLCVDGICVAPVTKCSPKAIICSAIKRVVLDTLLFNLRFSTSQLSLKIDGRSSQTNMRMYKHLHIPTPTPHSSKAWPVKSHSCDLPYIWFTTFWKWWGGPTGWHSL